MRLGTPLKDREAGPPARLSGLESGGELVGDEERGGSLPRPAAVSPSGRSGERSELPIGAFGPESLSLTLSSFLRGVRLGIAPVIIIGCARVSRRRPGRFRAQAWPAPTRSPGKDSQREPRRGNGKKSLPPPSGLTRKPAASSAKASKKKLPRPRRPRRADNRTMPAPGEGGKRKFSLRGAAPWAARHAAKRAAEAAERMREPPRPGSARATLRTPTKPTKSRPG